jgi:hypothetical protein
MAQFFPSRINMRVPAKNYTSNIEGAGIIYVNYGAPLALNNTLMFSALTAAAAGTFVPTDPLAQTEAAMTRYGRGLRLVASGAYAGVVTFRGRDYLGAPMREDITANGATPVLGLKAFRYLDSVTIVTTGAVTLDIGVTNLLGVPEKLVANVHEMKNGATSANAGTFTAGLANATAATATNADVRGTYLPVTVIPNGTNTFELRYIADQVNLHGNAQFNA